MKNFFAEMDSTKSLKYQLKTFRILGAWKKPSKFSIFYTIWTMILFVIVGFLFPLSQILSIFFASSISEMVDRMVITSSVVIVVVKAINVYTKQEKLQEFFHVIKRLDKKITEEAHIAQFNEIIKFSQQMYFSFFYSFLSTCVVLVFQTIYSKPSRRLWSSTYSYPYEWAQHPYVYVGGLFFQGIANTIVVLFAVSTDTYVAIFNHVLAGHIDVLNDRLQHLGDKEFAVDADKYHYDELVQCCRIYRDILR